MEQVNTLISNYGYMGIVFSQMLGTIGLPIPDQTIMLLVGYSTKIGTLRYTLALLISIVGTFGNILISYLIGKRAGRPFIGRFGKWIGLKESRILKVEKWMDKYGPLTILIGYFIPGMRQITCYLCGISRMKLKTICIYGLLTAVVWCSIFITIGRLFGRIG